MRKLFFIFCIAFSAMLRANAQSDTSNSNVKLFVDEQGIINNNQALGIPQCERLFAKTQQIINKTGIAEVGYSTFLVSPKLNVLDVTVDQTGVGKVYLAECELNINIERSGLGDKGKAVLNSFSKKILGSGTTSSGAIQNAVSGISSSDRDLVDFIVITKQKIADYFKVHCQDVLKQAQQALALKQYELAISLYFSVPVNAPCYEVARQSSVGVFNTYMDGQCELSLTKIKAYVAMGLKDPENYKRFIEIVTNLNPTTKCFAEAAKEIEKLESRFTDEQKQQWDFIKKQAQNETDVDKERYKAMDRISRNYQPPASAPTVIVTH